jgi:hypothetical protein
MSVPGSGREILILFTDEGDFNRFCDMRKAQKYEHRMTKKKAMKDPKSYAVDGSESIYQFADKYTGETSVDGKSVSVLKFVKKIAFDSQFLAFLSLSTSFRRAFFISNIT